MDSVQACAIKFPKQHSEMEDLIQQAQGGDAAAFERIYRHHVGRVYALCR